MSTDRIEKSIDLKAPIERVWRALSDHKEFGTWFRVAIAEPFEVGAVSRGNILYPGYEHIVWEATVVTMEPPRRFAFTWKPFAVDQNVDYSGETPTLVEFVLTPTDDGTHLIVTESGFDKVPAWRREEAFRSNEGGWEEQMRNVKAHVES